MTSRMLFTSGISDAVNAQAAVTKACQQALGQLGKSPCHLACVFASTIYRASWPALLEYIHQQLKPQVLIGCGASGIIGSEQELEWVPAVSILAAHLPDVHLYPFSVAPDELEIAEPGGFWIDKVGASPEDRPIFVMFADPFTVQPARLLQQVNQTYKDRPIVGGLVSGGREAGEHLLFYQNDVIQEGAVGVAMTGNITMETIVSQGCRPVGRPYVITECEDNLVLRLGGRPAVAVLHETLSALSSEDQELAQQGSVFAGLVVNEMRQKFASGDFLIRGVVGIDPDSGALALSEEVHVGQTFQFHLRDAATSRDELRRLLQRRLRSSRALPPAGALLFNCLGRGRSLYGTSHHDVKIIRMIRGNVPIGGFFANGEIGPLGSTNFLHGYTASLGLFRPSKRPRPRRGPA